MGRWIIVIAAFAIAAAVFWATRIDLLFGDTETKGASDMTEWVKLAISLVSLAIGIVNLRLALAKGET